MAAAVPGLFRQPRQQAAKPSAGVSVQFGFPSGVGQFRKRSLRSAAKSGPSPRLFLTSCPCEASRANNFLAGRSRAAILFFVATPERDQREPETQ